MSNYVANEVVTIDDANSPWINDKIRNLIQKKIIQELSLKKIMMYSKNFKI